MNLKKLYFLVDNFKTPSTRSTELLSVNNMLVAPSHSSSYAYTSSSVASRDNSKSHGSSTSNSNKYSLIKSFADHINRGTELFKQTVQKAILPRAPIQSLIEQQPLILSPGKCHRSLSLESDSGDSLKLEMCHFKPIRTMPTTPKRRNVSTRLKFPTAKKTYFEKKFVYNLGPIKSTYKPLQNRISAFSSLKVPFVLSKLPSPVNLSPSSPLSSSPKQPLQLQLTTTTVTSNIRKTRKRKIKNDNCPVPLRKSCRQQVINKTLITLTEKIIPKKVIKINNRVKKINNKTTTNLMNESKKLNDKEITEKKYIQEKEDLEFAKKLQNELNDGDTETVKNRVYSLRRKPIKPIIDIKLTTKNKKKSDVIINNVNENVRKSKRRR